MADDPTLIAVVDDEECVRKALGRLIRAGGFSVQTYASGSDFLLSIEQQRPHCVVLDLHMPHTSGFDVQEALMRTDARLPVVIITGDDSPEGRVRAIGRGAKAYLRKPVDDHVLLDAIAAAIREGRAAGCM